MRLISPGIFPAALLAVLAFIVGCSGEDETAERLDGASPGDRPPDHLATAQPSVDSLFVSYGAAHRTGPDTTGSAAWVAATLESMTLEEKIGQLFITHLNGGGTAPLSAVEANHVGGFLVPRLLEPRDVFAHVERLQEHARVPLFFAADYERGVGRFSDALTELPSNMAIGATRDPSLAAAAGRLTAIESRAIGVNMLFGPVLDVNNNPDNPIINIRSYGEEPELVGRMGASFVAEAQSHGLATTLKHFPGHGNTAVDSHTRMGVIEGDRAALEATELRPYRIVLGGESPSAAVMTAHLWIRAFEPEPLPATFSPVVLSGLLREEMGFHGIVVTDDVRMGALQTDYDVTERILRPLEAGADIVLTPEDLPRAIAIVKEGVRSGRITEARVDASVRRILTAKAAGGLHAAAMPERERLDVLMEEPKGAHIAKAIAERSITLLKSSTALQLQNAAEMSIIHLTNYRGSESIAAAMDLLDASFGVEESARYDADPPAREAQALLARSAESDVVVLALYLRLQAGRGEAGLLPEQASFVHRLLERDVPVVLVTFGNPYAASTFRSADAIVVAYDQSLATIRAAARVLSGEQPAQGRLPITVEPFPRGSGTDAVR